MLAMDVRWNSRAAMVVVVLLVSVGCSFKNKGINLELGDADETGGDGTGARDGGVGDRSPALDRAADRASGEDRPVAGDAEPAPDVPLSVDAGLPPGAACAGDGTCASGFCVDKVCCESRCGDPCHACLGLTTGAADGLCRPEVVNTPCGSAMCSGATHTPAPRCDGNGACLPKPAAPCGGSLACATATTCKTKCAVDADCTGGAACDTASGACVPPGKPNGQSCMMGGECRSGSCADGVCCDLACTGTCRACVMAQTGKPNGTCANVLAGTKDTRCQRECHDGTCDDTGACRPIPDGTKCGAECCRGGAAGRICTFRCDKGVCDRTHPDMSEHCGQGPGPACCCMTANGPMCGTILECGLNACVQ